MILFVVLPVGASNGRRAYNEKDPQCKGGAWVDEYGVSESKGLDVSKEEILKLYSREREVELLKGINKALRDINDNLRSENVRLKSRWFWTWIFLSFVVGGGAGFFFGRVGRQISIGVPSPLHVDNGLPKCPRCGKEHDHGDSVCKNPNCRTQF